MILLCAHSSVLGRDRKKNNKLSPYLIHCRPLTVKRRNKSTKSTRKSRANVIIITIRASQNMNDAL
jgi:hypothetical protein